MPLDHSKLENARQRGGKLLARCPACAEAGADKSGEHLVILDGGAGKWGCIAFPGPHGHLHRKRIAELAGTGPTDSPRPFVARVVTRASRPVRPLPAMRTPTASDLAEIARIRKWPTHAGLDVLVERGQLFIADVWDDGKTWPAWIATDASRANAQARKLDGGVWTGIGGKKPKSLPGTTTLRMIGSCDIGTRPTIWLTEGTPDFLAAAIVARRDGLDLDKIAFVCVTGANENTAPLHADDVAHFANKRVVIAVHHDREHGLGGRAAARWAEQLYRAGAAEVVGFDFAGYAGKDLADFLCDSRPVKPAPAVITPEPAAIAPKAMQSPPTRPPLAPLEQPWIDGARYRLAGLHEVKSRLPLFIIDPNGDTRRAHGVLIFDPILKTRDATGHAYLKTL